MRNWHRIFGVSVATIVRGLPFNVFPEFELSLLTQRLDTAVVVVEGTELCEQHWPGLPDGLTDLADHNLFTYKAINDTLSLGSILELLSHLVLYCKQKWGDDWEAGIDRVEQFRLIAVATHHPRWLAPERNAHQQQNHAGRLRSPAIERSHPRDCAARSKAHPGERHLAFTQRSPRPRGVWHAALPRGGRHDV